MATCGQKTEVYSRVCGYFRPVTNWNKGKQEEFKDRLPYSSFGSDSQGTYKINITDKMIAFAKEKQLRNFSRILNIPFNKLVKKQEAIKKTA
jgi:ribonucleoside-triphosphate reductase